MITTTAVGRTWHFSHALGRPTGEQTENLGGFRIPISVAIAPNDILFVLSRGNETSNSSPDGQLGDPNRRIGKVTIDEEWIGDFARREFTWPAGIAVAGDGNVYCSDEYENWVAFFDPDKTYPFPEYNPEGEKLGQWGEAGSKEGQLNGPAGLMFDSEDNLLLVDSRNHRVQKFTKEGRFLASWGSYGSGEGEFNLPWGITIDREGNVYVADWGNDRVQKFTQDGVYLMSFPSAHAGGELDHPADVAVDSEGDVYVADWGIGRVQIYDPEGDILTALYGDATKLSKAGEYIIRRDPGTIKAFRMVEDYNQMGKLWRPTSIAVDDQDRVVIADSAGRLQVYVKDKDYVEPDVKLELNL